MAGGNKYQKLKEQGDDENNEANTNTAAGAAASSSLLSKPGSEQVPSAVDDDDNNDDNSHEYKKPTATTIHSFDSYDLETIEMDPIDTKDDAMAKKDSDRVPLPPPSYDETGSSQPPPPPPGAAGSSSSTQGISTGVGSSNSNTNANNNDGASSQTQATHPSPPQGQNATNDGVFSNISAKPDLYMGYENGVPEETLPSYQDIYGNRDGNAASGMAPYFEPAVVTISDTDELLIEGLPVGNFAIFLVNLAVSAGFQFIGFMMTFLLHSTHAARSGSLTGLGITFILYGFYMQGPMGMAPPEGSDPTDPEVGSMYLTYVLIVIGWFIMLKGVADYIRVRRLQAIIESSPEENV
ncbi:hypothetical protein H4219_004740 [Mycoemilia scoparia]|uniref:Uncharacterized protein n=1 Tax=Mycoemilia scoparia TaxID=417184 RepID=A0A9W8A066_9FUNG|nr:hypothetical protein H4219_004740 [Mycoemilia scoparia]